MSATTARLSELLREAGVRPLEPVAADPEICGVNLDSRRIEPGDPLHWTGRLQRWNTMCAECHSTALDRGYDVAEDRYRTA